MRICLTQLVLPGLLALTAVAQTPVSNQALRSYNVNDSAAAASTSSSPIEVVVHTDCPLTLNIQASFNPLGFPVLMLFDAATTLGNTIQIGAFDNFGVQLDLRDKGSNGYADQILFDGFARPSPETWTDITGKLSVTTTLPACQTVAGLTSCLTAANADQFEVSSQAIVLSTTSPVGVASTAAVRGTFENGYREWLPGSVVNDQSASFGFQQGFTFKYYGVTYTQAFISENGFISFGAVDSSFPTPNVAMIRSGVPRVMSLYTDLQLNPPSSGSPTKMYAQQYCENGVRKVRFVHQRLAEFGNATGPHGGEIVITENGDIAVYLASYQTTTSIDTGVGITPGGNLGPAVTGFGSDLSLLSGTMTTLAPAASAFEVFDTASVVPANPLDLIGFGAGTGNAVGQGLVLLQNTALANTTPTNSGYIIQ